jgi:hypothetical protein
MNVQMRVCLFAIGFVVLAPTAGLCQAKSNATPATVSPQSTPVVFKDIGIVWVGTPNESLLRRVGDFVGATCRCDVRVADSILATNTAVQAIEGTAAGALRDSDMCLIALCNLPGSAKFRVGLFPQQRIVLVNAAMLKPKDVSTADATERYARRVEKESLFMLGQLLGLGGCPNKLCCMHPAMTGKDLDEIARNYCPPCQGAVLKALIAKGLTLKTGAPHPPASK